MISTHILDTHKGTPAKGVQVRLERQMGQDWSELGVGKTNDDGRVVYDVPKENGVYRLVFEVEDYYAKTEQEFFFPQVPVIFKISNTDRKYHVPLLLNPFGFTTYRGS